MKVSRDLGKGSGVFVADDPGAISILDTGAFMGTHSYSIICRSYIPS